MRIGNHSLCGVWCFLTDKETEAFFFWSSRENAGPSKFSEWEQFGSDLEEFNSLPKRSKQTETRAFYTND